MTEFFKRHIGIRREEQTQMLNDLGLSSLDELVKTSCTRFNITSW